jgi:Bacterial pre-peptidase C-terminal domain
MNKQRTFSRTLLAIALAALWSSGMALDPVPEVEPNEGALSAQPLSFDSTTRSVTVNGSIRNVGPVAVDADFYSFQGQKGSTITIDIDGGFVRGTSRKLDSALTLFAKIGPYNYRWLYEVNDIVPIDEGSLSSLDARIDNFLLTETGTYTVAVTSTGVRFVQGTGLPTYFSSGETPLLQKTHGSYTLIITVVSPPVMQIKMEVKPGSGEYAPLNPKAKGTIPVALLSSEEFNALDVAVDVKTLTFGATGDEQSLRRCGKEGEDVNADGLLDLVCHFDNQATKYTVYDEEGTVKGKMKLPDGRAFEGRALLKVVPVKREE